MRVRVTGLLGLITGLGTVMAASGQVAEPDRARAAVIVEGTARGSYRNVRPELAEAVVAIEARRSELGAVKSDGRLEVPRPGDLIYVHAPGGSAGLPGEGTSIRAYLTPRPEGGWQGVAAGWYESTERSEPTPPSRPSPTTPEPDDAPVVAGLPLDTLGVDADELRVQGRYALKVTSVRRGGPAQKAGLEPGDVIIGIDGQPLGGLEELGARIGGGGSFEAMVVDINTGKVAKVPVEIVLGTTRPRPSEPTPPATPTPTPAPPAARSLGIAAEPVQIGQRTALKVVRVTPELAGAKAGLEPGDVIVAANGAPVTGVEQLAAALRKSGPTMELTVRDTRSGKEVAVPVDFGEVASRPTPAPAPTAPPPPSSTREEGVPNSDLGAVTELVFLDTEAAVRVTEVRAGSPAERAGLAAGDVVVEADGKLVLHPNELVEAARNARGTMQLGVLKQGAGRKQSVRITLGAR